MFGKKYLEHLSPEDQAYVSTVIAEARAAGHKRVGVAPAPYIGPLGNVRRTVCNVLVRDVGEWIYATVWVVDSTGKYFHR